MLGDESKGNADQLCASARKRKPESDTSDNGPKGKDPAPLATHLIAFSLNDGRDHSGATQSPDISGQRRFHLGQGRAASIGRASRKDTEVEI